MLQVKPEVIVFEYLGGEPGYALLLLFLTGACIWALGLAAYSDYLKTIGYTVFAVTFLAVIGLKLLTIFPSIWLDAALMLALIIVFTAGTTYAGHKI